MKRVFLYADGGSRGNPGPSGSGAVLFDERGEVLFEVSKFLGTATNNIAEYTALLEGLHKAVTLLGAQLEGVEFVVRMDSELVIKQMKGIYKVKHPNLKPLYAEIVEVVDAHVPHIRYEHVPRAKNAHADKLANDAMDRKR